MGRPSAPGCARKASRRGANSWHPFGMQNPTPRRTLPAQARRARRVEEVATAPGLQRGAVGATHPAGVTAISRWLSAAIPPVTMTQQRIDPGGVVAAATPPGSGSWGDLRPPGALAKPRDAGLIAGIPSGCKTQRLAALYRRKLAALDELKKSLLHRAFSGEL